MLWRVCGLWHNTATAGHVTPSISDLGLLVQIDRKRAQFYANFIHVLGFGNESQANAF